MDASSTPDGKKPNNDSIKLTSLYETYLKDILLMLQHCRNDGKNLPENLSNDVAVILDSKGKLREKEDFNLIIKIHGQLSALVAPASPESLAATDFSLPDSRPLKVLLWFLIPAASLGVLVYVITLAFIDVSKNQVSPSLNASLLIQVNFLFAAIIGAAFNGLLTAYDYIKNRSFDPDYITAYLIRFALGILAGIVVSNLGSGLFQGNDILAKLGPGIIALLGGYSAEAVRKILDRLVDVLVTAIQGKDTSSSERAKVAKDLVEIAQTAADEDTPQSVKDKINGLLQKLQQ